MSRLHLLFVVLFVAMAGACQTGLDEWQPQSGNPDDPVFADDDDTTEAADDDDTTEAGDDDDTTEPTDDDDTLPTDDDDTSGDDYEGDEPGECEDGADNDQNGLFDCDDPNCAGSPACAGDDDDSTEPSDDDDTTPPADDDDATPPPPGAPVITSVVDSWNGAAAEFDFEIYMSDGDCDLGNPNLWWILDGAPQGALTIGGSPFTCSGSVTFTVGGLTAGYSYTFGFYIDDAAGNLSATYTVVTSAT